jgi:hypothetical protein
MNVNTIVSGLGAIASAASAFWWLRASLVSVPANIDTIIKVLQQVSAMNAYAAGATGLGAICAVVLFTRGVVVELDAHNASSDT